MARGRLRTEWDQTSVLWAILAEPHRDPRSRSEPFTPADIHPYMEREEVERAGPDLALWAEIRRDYKVTKLGKLQTVN